MDDLISRQAAIEMLAIGEELLKRVLDDMDVVGNEREKYEWGLGLIESYIADMKDLPSAQPEPSIEIIEEILNYLDTTLHPIVSPDNWNVYSELYDMVSSLSSSQPDHNADHDKKVSISCNCENDLISRQAAIDAIRASTSKYTGFIEMEMYTDDDAIEAIEGLPSAQPKKNDDDFEEKIHRMFDHIWECEIEHPIFQDTVGELMSAVIQLHNQSMQPEPNNDVEFWRNRANYYGEICMNLVSKISEGIKYDSVSIDENGITFKTK